MLAAGTIAGHIIECGAQCSGGNCQVDWQNIPDMANVGYPMVEAEPDGSFTVTKHAVAGGRVNIHTVKEQLLYELGDPKNYITPDCVADFTSIQLDDAGPCLLYTSQNVSQDAKILIPRPDVKHGDAGGFGFSAGRSYGAVSYTHLDVYKRQPEILRLAGRT